MNKTAKIITAGAACAAAIGLGIFAVLISKDKKAVPTYSDIIETTSPTEGTTAELPDDLADKYGYVPSQLGKTDRAKALTHVNRDAVGWIKVDGRDSAFSYGGQGYCRMRAEEKEGARK